MVFSIQKIVFRVLNSRKWRLTWGGFEPRTKLNKKKIQNFLNFTFLNFFFGSNPFHVAPFPTTDVNRSYHPRSSECRVMTKLELSFERPLPLVCQNTRT